MNIKNLLLLALAGFVPALALAPAVAHAGEVEKAEHRRLSEEMKKRAQTNAWSGVERSFQELLELQKKGEPLTYQDWFLGAQAARGLGNISDCRGRLEQAIKVEATDEAKNWLAEIDANYVRVSLRSTDKESAAQLAIEGMPFAADQRKAVETAQQQVAESRGFEGLLPVGSYTFSAGDASEKFALASGQAPVEVKLGAADVAPDPDGGGLAYVGPRLDVGGAFTMAGAARTPEEIVGPTDSFGGPGARVGLGVEMGLSKSFGLGVQVGYHNLMGGGATPAGDNGEYTIKGDQIHMGFGQLTANLRFGNVWLGVGGLYGAGVGNATGISPEQFVIACQAEGTPETACAEFAQDTDALAQLPWSGSLKMPGATASFSYALFNLGPSLKGAVTLQGGAMVDNQRSYPWGEVAFTIAPVPARRK